MFVEAEFLVPTVISMGLCINSFAMRATSLGMVAENNHVCLSFGVCERIFVMSSLKPMFSISSASSKIQKAIEDMLMYFLRIISCIRPGVATKTCAPFLTALAWSLMLAPPYIGTIFKPLIAEAYLISSLLICMHNSRVGAITSPCVVLLFVSIFCSMGNPKAAVLPVPVWASTTISVSFSKRMGTAFC